MNNRIALGGGCHWCTEGVFLSLKGVVSVQQGWVSSFQENESFSEAIIVEFDDKIISLKDLIEVHLYTHASTSQHSMRKKYRSAVYAFSEEQKQACENIIMNLQSDFDEDIVTKVLVFNDFKLNKEELLNYLFTRPNTPFCQNYIHPKLRLLMKKFSNKVDHEKMTELGL